MSSSIDKKYGDMFIFGKYSDGYVDLVWSSGIDEFTLKHVHHEQATRLMEVWDNQRDYMHEMYEKLAEARIDGIEFGVKYTDNTCMEEIAKVKATIRELRTKEKSK